MMTISVAMMLAIIMIPARLVKYSGSWNLDMRSIFLHIQNGD